MSGNPDKASIWNDADVYVAPVGTANPIDIVEMWTRTRTAHTSRTRPWSATRAAATVKKNGRGTAPAYEPDQGGEESHPAQALFNGPKIGILGCARESVHTLAPVHMLAALIVPQPRR